MIIGGINCCCSINSQINVIIIIIVIYYYYYYYYFITSGCGVELGTELRRTSLHGGAGCAGRTTTESMTSSTSVVRSSRHQHVCGLESPERRREYIKKPLNAFMLFMKEKRQRVIEECTLKESAAINQILGRKVSLAHTVYYC